MALGEGIYRGYCLVGQNDGEHDLRRELVGDGFEDGDGKFAS